MRVGGAGAHHRNVSANSPSAAAGARLEDALYPAKHFDEREDVDVPHVASPPRQWIAWKLRSLFFWYGLSMPSQCCTGSRFPLQAHESTASYFALDPFPGYVLITPRCNCAFPPTSLALVISTSRCLFTPIRLLPQPLPCLELLLPIRGPVDAQDGPLERLHRSNQQHAGRRRALHPPVGSCERQVQCKDGSPHHCLHRHPPTLLDDHVLLIRSDAALNP